MEQPKGKSPVSKSREGRALFRVREQARKSHKDRSNQHPIITPVSPEAMTAFAGHVAALAESQPVELNLFSIVELFDRSIEPALAFAARQWMINAARGTLPICLTCDHQWHGIGDTPPAGFAIVASYSKVGAAVCSGLCQSCYYQADLLQRCVDRYRPLLGPDIYAQVVSSASAGLQ
jgi:hypothetical protein